MEIPDIPTQPLAPLFVAPILVVIDSVEERRVWVTRLLVAARYEVAAFETMQDALSWMLFGQNVLYGLLLGQFMLQERIFLERLLQRTPDWRDRPLAVIPLESSFPLSQDQQRRAVSFAPTAQGCVALLETLRLIEA